MDLQTYLAAIRRSWLLIIVFTLLAAGLGTALFLATPRTYVSKVDFYVSTPQAQNSNPQAAGEFAVSRVNSYIILLSSEQLASRVIAATGLPLTPPELSSKITASAQLNTVVVNTVVTDSNPDRSLQIARGVADTFGQMVDQLDNVGRQNVVIHVVSGPTLNPHAVSPQPKLYIGGAIAAGLLIGLAIAILREVLDDSVRTAETAQRVLDAPLIATIDYDTDARRSPLIVGGQAASGRAESFRQLRTSLQFIGASRNADALLVTSTVNREGKTSTAVNLALAFAELGDRVLLVDADFRQPRAAAVLDLPNRVGLADVLTDQVGLDDAIQAWGQGRLSLLPSGSSPSNPTELLGSSRMQAIMAELRGHFDKVVVDSPPVLPVADAVVLSSVVDAVVVVIRSGKTPRAQVATAATALDRVGAVVIGGVLNGRRAGHGGAHQKDRRPNGNDDRGRPDWGDRVPGGAIEGDDARSSFSSRTGGQ